MVEKFKIIYTDNPYEFPKRNDGKKFGKGSSQYWTLTDEELIAMKPLIDGITYEDSIILSWASGALDYRNNKIMEAWGFQKITKLFCWEKVDKKGNPRNLAGNYTGNCTEDVWMYRRPECKKILKRYENLVPSLIRAPLREHSRKPDEIRQRITRVFGEEVSKIELFGRIYPDTKYTEGWKIIGGDIDNMDIRYVLMNMCLDELSNEDLYDIF